MRAPVNPSRRYDSPRRREQAAATRRAILDAAERLFADRGYAATSVPTIAAEAGVAVKTVYVAFATKAGLLHALWDNRLGGDDQPVSVLERPWYRQLISSDDPEQLLRATAHQSRTVKDRAGTVMRIVRHAAITEPAITDLWDRIETEFRAVLQGVARRLDTLRALADHLDTATATDILWTLNHPDTWYLLIHRCGWTADQYEQWVADTLCAQLLRTPPRPSPQRLTSGGASDRPCK